MQDVERLDRYRRYVVIAIATILTVGVIALAFVLFGRGVLPPAIEITPERFTPFDKPVCPGESVLRSVTYVVNRPAVLEIDAVIYDLDKRRPVPTTQVESSRPAPYAIRETMPFTFTVPDLPPSKYEWQVGISSKNQSSFIAFWFIEFEIAEGCDPLPTAEPTP